MVTYDDITCCKCGKHLPEHTLVPCGHFVCQKCNEEPLQLCYLCARTVLSTKSTHSLSLLKELKRGPPKTPTSKQPKDKLPLLNVKVKACSSTPKRGCKKVKKNLSHGKTKNTVDTPRPTIRKRLRSSESSIHEGDTPQIATPVSQEEDQCQWSVPMSKEKADKLKNEYLYKIKIANSEDKELNSSQSSRRRQLRERTTPKIKPASGLDSSPEGRKSSQNSASVRKSSRLFAQSADRKNGVRKRKLMSDGAFSSTRRRCCPSDADDSDDFPPQNREVKSPSTKRNKGKSTKKSNPETRAFSQSSAEDLPCTTDPPRNHDYSPPKSTTNGYKKHKQTPLEGRRARELENRLGTVSMSDSNESLGCVISASVSNPPQIEKKPRKHRLSASRPFKASKSTTVCEIIPDPARTPEKKKKRTSLSTLATRSMRSSNVADDDVEFIKSQTEGMRDIEVVAQVHADPWISSCSTTGNSQGQGNENVLLSKQPVETDNVSQNCSPEFLGFTQGVCGGTAAHAQRIPDLPMLDSHVRESFHMLNQSGAYCLSSESIVKSSLPPVSPSSKRQMKIPKLIIRKPSKNKAVGCFVRGATGENLQAPEIMGNCSSMAATTTFSNSVYRKDTDPLEMSTSSWDDEASPEKVGECHSAAVTPGRSPCLKKTPRRSCKEKLDYSKPSMLSASLSSSDGDSNAVLPPMPPGRSPSLKKTRKRSFPENLDDSEPSVLTAPNSSEGHSNPALTPVPCGRSPSPKKTPKKSFQEKLDDSKPSVSTDPPYSSNRPLTEVMEKASSLSDMVEAFTQTSENPYCGITALSWPLGYSLFQKLFTRIFDNQEPHTLSRLAFNKVVAQFGDFQIFRGLNAVSPLTESVVKTLPMDVFEEQSTVKVDVGKEPTKRNSFTRRQLSFVGGSSAMEVDVEVESEDIIEGTPRKVQPVVNLLNEYIESPLSRTLKSQESLAHTTPKQGAEPLQEQQDLPMNFESCERDISRGNGTHFADAEPQLPTPITPLTYTSAAPTMLGVTPSPALFTTVESARAAPLKSLPVMFFTPPPMAPKKSLPVILSASSPTALKTSTQSAPPVTIPAAPQTPSPVTVASTLVTGPYNPNVHQTTVVYNESESIIGESQHVSPKKKTPLTLPLEREHEPVEDQQDSPMNLESRGRDISRVGMRKPQLPTPITPLTRTSVAPTLLGVTPSPALITTVESARAAPLKSLPVILSASPPTAPKTPAPGAPPMTIPATSQTPSPITVLSTPVTPPYKPNAHQTAAVYSESESIIGESEHVLPKKKTPFTLPLDGSNLEKSVKIQQSSLGSPQPLKNISNIKEVAMSCIYDHAQVSAIYKLINLMKAKYSREVTKNTTHLIVASGINGIDVTRKILMALYKGAYILPFKWVEDCLESGSILPEDSYLPPHKGIQRRSIFPQKTALFKGFAFHLSSEIQRDQLNYVALKKLMEFCDCEIVDEEEDLLHLATLNKVVFRGANYIPSPFKGGEQVVHVSFRWFYACLATYEIHPFDMVEYPVS